MKQKTKTEVKTTLKTTKKKQWVKPEMTVMSISNRMQACSDGPIGPS